VLVVLAALLVLTLAAAPSRRVKLSRLPARFVPREEP
jgi:hypothetical protein